MKLAIFGLATAILGAALGVAGLVISGAFWVVLGLLVWALFTRHEKGRAERAKAAAAAGAASPPERRGRYATGISLVVLVGLGSLAIGIFELGFDAEESAWRWLPIGVGAIVTLFAAISIPIRMSGATLAAAEAAGAPVAAATVTIEGKRQTGTYINEQPRIEFDLLVEPEGLPSYRVKKKATVPHTALGNLDVGDGFHAKVDPGDEERILIDWDAPIEGSGDPAKRLERLDDLRRRGLVDDAEYAAQRQRILDSL